MDGPGEFALFDSGGDDWGAPRVLLGDGATLLFAVDVDVRRVTEEHCGLTVAEFAAGPEVPGPDEPGPGPDPDVPGPDPDDPGTDPDDPGAGPDDPGADPDGPGSDPDGPGTNDDTPAPTPSTSGPSANGGDGTPGAGPAPSDRGPLASTGFEAGEVVLLAVSLVGAGLVLIELRRRSRARRRPATG